MVTWEPWKPSRGAWNLDVDDSLESARTPSASDASKHAHELRILNLLLPLVLPTAPSRAERRESPDFELELSSGRAFVEIVDAIPDAVSKSGRMNVAKRRSRENNDSYHVDPAQFADAIAQQIEAKRIKASTWLRVKPQLKGHLVLLVNAGQGAFSLQDYARDRAMTARIKSIATIDPFSVVVVGDDSGAFVCGALV